METFTVLRLGRHVIEPEGAQRPRHGVQPGLRGVTGLRLRGAAALRRPLALLGGTTNPLGAVAQFDRRVSRLGSLAGNDLHHRVGRRLNHGARDLVSLVIEYLGHAQLLADDP